MQSRSNGSQPAKADQVSDIMILAIWAYERAMVLFWSLKVLHVLVPAHHAQGCMEQHRSLCQRRKKGDLLCRQNNHDTHSSTLLFLHSILQARLCTIAHIARDLKQFYASQCMQVRIKLFQAPMYAGSHKIASNLEQSTVLCIIWLARLNVEI